MKKILLKEVTLQQAPDSFFDEKKGKDVNYTAYSMIINGKTISLSGIKAVAKVRLEDMFENVKESV